VAIQGTGAISLLLNGFPYGNERQIVTILTLAFFFLNLVLFCLFTAITIARYALFPDVWSIMLYHPVQSLYIGCFPMGAATLINVAATMINVRCGFGGRPFLLALWGCWWLDVTASLLCCWGMAHIMSVPACTI
jgi:tellurite resistance protein TehA-like permease